MEKMTQHQLGQIKQKLSKLSQKFELVAAGFILRFITHPYCCYLLFTAHSLLLTAHYSLFTFHYPLEAGENFVQ